MAYKCVVNKVMTTKAGALTEIDTQMVAMGWTYVDGKTDGALLIPYTDVNVTNNTFTKVGHTLTNGQPVQLITSGTAPAGLAVLTAYHVVGVSGDTFKLATTYNGTEINITGQGTGNHSIVESYRIYSSNGENSDQITQFIKLYSFVSATQIRVLAAYNYNMTTRSFEGGSVVGNYGVVTTNETGFYLWIHGNKDKVSICTKVVSTYYRMLFGFLKPFHTLKTTLTEAATSGSSVVLSVTSSVGFEVGYSYLIVGATAEGRDSVTVTAIGIGTITVSSLPRNYSSGSFIGIMPCIFGPGNDTAFSITCPVNSSGLTISSYGTGSYDNLLGLITASDPDQVTQKYILQPIALTDCTNADTTATGWIGYSDDNVFIAPSVGMTIEDTFAVGKLSSGTSSGTNNTSSVMYDTSKSWTTNEFANKVVIIILGTGTGLIKKIASNTATTITLDTVIFESVPDNTSQYIICDEGYRYMASGTGVGTAASVALKEGI